VLLGLALLLAAALYVLKLPARSDRVAEGPVHARTVPPVADTGQGEEAADGRAQEGKGVPAADPRASPRQIRVRVVSTMGPLSGAEVRLGGSDLTLTTDADGVVDLGTDDLGVVSVQACKEGYCTAEAWIPGGVDATEIVLVPGAPLHGRVVRAGDGAPVAGAEVRAADRATGDELCPVLTADSEGCFTVPGVAPGTQVVVGASAPGFAPAVATGVAGSGEIRVVLGQGATVRGIIRGADGRTAEGVAVRVFPEEDDFLARAPNAALLGQHRLRAAARAESDANGEYEVDGLAPGRYVLLAWSAPGGSCRTTFGVTSAAEPLHVNLVLEATGCILVRVVRPDGGPVPNARLILTDSAGDWIYRATVPLTTDARGEALATGLEPGSYEIVVQPELWTAARAQVVVERGPPKEVRIDVAAGATLEGTVRDAAGNPVAGLDVSFDLPGDSTIAPQHKKGISRHDGSFRLEGLLPLPGVLSISDWAERWLPHVEERALPGGPPLSIVVGSSAGVTGRFEPTPVSRRVAYTVVKGDSMSGREDLALDAEGRFVLPGLDEGADLALYFDVPDGCLIRCPVAPLARGERRDLGVLTVVAGRTLRGHAVDGSGAPWTFTRVQLTYEDYGVDRYALTDGSGRFAFEHMDPAAKISLTVWNSETTGQYFEVDDWTNEPVQELVVER